MNNLKYYNDSLAYDFDMFAPKKAPSGSSYDNIVVMPKKANQSQKRRAAATKRLSAPVTLVLCAVMVLSALCGNIALRLQINEVNSEINDMRAVISELDSEKTS